MDRYDAVVVGGGPSGATAAHDLACAGHSVLLLDRGGRVKPCGGAVPPRLLEEFDVPESILVNRVDTARILSPKGRTVDIPVGEGFVGMVDRGPFDEWLRTRAESAGAVRIQGHFQAVEGAGTGSPVVVYREGGSRSGALKRVGARFVVGADGALSGVARQAVPGSGKGRFVFAYHEIIRSPEEESEGFGAARCDVYYEGRFSPDFYSWVFPHGDTTSVGTGTEIRGFDMRGAIRDLRARTGLDRAETIRTEGAPIPLKPLPRWENGRDVILAGDAAGVVAPSSGEGIFYAMTGGRLAARSVDEALVSASPAPLRRARRRFLMTHGMVFTVLGVMQRFWYRDDHRRERFVAIARDRDVQELTFEGYMQKELVRARPLAHARIFFKNLGHLTGVVSA
jgi:geranylgeranyl diphosphate/geranylgeranyl-bacteriochlorophyllide a reductase